MKRRHRVKYELGNVSETVSYRRFRCRVELIYQSISPPGKQFEFFLTDGRRMIAHQIKEELE
jgi:hypothetical protein